MAGNTNRNMRAGWCAPIGSKAAMPAQTAAARTNQCRRLTPAQMATKHNPATAVTMTACRT
jgi:hypothetical protein